MPSKVAYIDVETTGTDPTRHGIIQLAALFEIDGTIDRELNLRMCPLRTHTIDPEALTVTNTTEEQIRAYPHPADQFKVFESTLAYYINKYDKFDKFVLCGYNVANFDVQFLRQFFIDNAVTRKDRKYGNYYGSWFFWPTRDAQTYLAEHITENGLRLPNYRLGTVCEHFGIPIDAHDALSDIHATRTLYRALRYSLSATPT